jgi:membrane protein DedA with SNARE-associated domain
MEALLAQIIAFLESHQSWAPWFAFALAFAETLAFVSIVIPSTAILVGVGGLVATGALTFFPIWIGASLGSLAGSLLSFWLGRRYGSRLLDGWPFDRHPGLVARATHTFKRWGVVAIFIGHFFGPLRSVVFVLAGASRMRWGPFLMANIPGALIWAFAIPKSGEIGGDIIGHLWGRFFGS